MYFSDAFPEAYGISPRADMRNLPEDLMDDSERAALPWDAFIAKAAEAVARRAGLSAL